MNVFAFQNARWAFTLCKSKHLCIHYKICPRSLQSSFIFFCTGRSHYKMKFFVHFSCGCLLPLCCLCKNPASWSAAPPCSWVLMSNKAQGLRLHLHYLKMGYLKINKGKTCSKGTRENKRRKKKRPKSKQKITPQIVAEHNMRSPKRRKHKT